MDYRDYKEGLARGHFWFRGKRELIAILLGRLGLPGGSRILNVGAGVGEDLGVIGRFGKVYALDSDPGALDMIDSSLVAEKVLGDVAALPYEDGHFEAAVAFDVLEHIEDDEKAVAELTRALKPGGYLVVTVPAFNFLYGMHDINLGHLRRYDRKSLAALMSGLDEVGSGYWMSLLFPLALVSRLLSRTAGLGMIEKKALNRYINWLMYRILHLENRLIHRGFCMPPGTTIYGIYQKRVRSGDADV